MGWPSFPVIQTQATIAVRRCEVDVASGQIGDAEFATTRVRKRCTGNRLNFRSLNWASAFAAKPEGLIDRIRLIALLNDEIRMTRLVKRRRAKKLQRLSIVTRFSLS